MVDDAIALGNVDLRGATDLDDLAVGHEHDRFVDHLARLGVRRAEDRLAAEQREVLGVDRFHE